MSAPVSAPSPPTYEPGGLGGPSTASGWSLTHHRTSHGTEPADTGTREWSTQQAQNRPRRRLLAPVTGLGVAAIIGVVLCAVTAIITGWQEFTAAAVILGVLLLVSGAFLVGRTSYDVTIDLHNGRVVAGEQATGSLSVRNSGTRRLLGSRMELPVGASTATFRIPSLPAGGEHEELFVIPTARRSVISVGPAISVRGDAVGLLRRQVRWTSPEELFVHPMTATLHGSATGSVKDLEGQPTKDLSSNDVSFHALRQYVPGDDRRYVHWKTSARTGTLMVRQFEETRRTHLAVALSIDPAEYVTQDEFELAISAAASLGSQAMREERPVSVCAGPRLLRAANARRLLDTCSAIDPLVDGGLLPAARAAAAAVPNASVAVLITGPMPDAALVRRAGAAFPVGVRVVAVRVQENATFKLSSIAPVDVATVGKLDDFGQALRRMRAA